MKRQLRGILLTFAVALGLGACAAPGPTSSNAPVAAKVSTPAAATTASTASKNAPQAFGNYIKVVRAGQTLYCQKDTDTSTRMSHETCLTQAQAEAQQENARNFVQGTQGLATTPVTGTTFR